MMTPTSTLNQDAVADAEFNFKTTGSKKLPYNQLLEKLQKKFSLTRNQAMAAVAEVENRHYRADILEIDQCD